MLQKCSEWFNSLVSVEEIEDPSLKSSCSAVLIVHCIVHILTAKSTIWWLFIYYALKQEKIICHLALTFTYVLRSFAFPRHIFFPAFSSKIVFGITFSSFWVLCLLQKGVIWTEKPEKSMFYFEPASRKLSQLKLFYFPEKDAVGSDCIFSYGGETYTRNLDAVHLFFMLFSRLDDF